MEHKLKKGKALIIHGSNVYEKMTLAREIASQYGEYAEAKVEHFFRSAYAVGGMLANNPTTLIVYGLPTAQDLHKFESMISKPKIECNQKHKPLVVKDTPYFIFCIEDIHPLPMGQIGTTVTEWSPKSNKDIDAKDISAKQNTHNRPETWFPPAYYHAMQKAIDAVNYSAQNRHSLPGMKSTFRGHSIIWDGAAWLYADTKEPIPGYSGESRPCNKCGANEWTQTAGYDECLGKLPGVVHACCGHGDRDAAYIVFRNGVVIRGYWVEKPDRRD